MFVYLIPIFVGAVLMITGISNLKGNISSIHSYHTHRVKQEDKKAFGELMGVGTIICSLGIMIFGLLSMLSDSTGNYSLMSIGSWCMVLCFIVGIGFMTYATIKYNKGLF